MDHCPQYLCRLVAHLTHVDSAGGGIVLGTAAGHDLADTRKRHDSPYPRFRADYKISSQG